MAVKTDGTLWGWGQNSFGQLGDGGAVSKSSPVQIGTLTGWSKVYAGASWTMSVKTDGTLWGWGTNNQGQIGVGDFAIKKFDNNTDWSKLSFGTNHILAIKTNGTLWSWGNNSSGQL